MRALVKIGRFAALSVGLALVTGCSQWPHIRQGQMPCDPAEALPEWAFDAPYYFLPPPEGVPQPASRPAADFPTHYYVRDKLFLVERPANEVPADRAPRIAIWWTDTDGCVWNRAGYFGLSQTYFPFLVGDDADYGIRFVGPGIRESLTSDTIPHRIYHVDRVPPTVYICVSPDLPVFDPGQTLNISWVIHERFLDPRSVRLNITWGWENPDMPQWRPDQPLPVESGDPDKLATRHWHPYKKDLEAEGAFLYDIPKHITGESFQFQVRAQDLAGNYGVGYTRVLFVGGYTDQLAGIEWAEPGTGAGPTEAASTNEPQPGKAQEVQTPEPSRLSQEGAVSSEPEPPAKGPPCPPGASPCPPGGRQAKDRNPTGKDSRGVRDRAGPGTQPSRTSARARHRGQGEQEMAVPSTQPAAVEAPQPADPRLERPRPIQQTGPGRSHSIQPAGRDARSPVHRVRIGDSGELGASPTTRPVTRSPSLRPIVQ